MSIDVSPFTDEQWWSMCDVHLDLPVPLAKADLLRPFIYDRKWGVFYCPPGLHLSGMSLLLAFHMGLNKGVDVAEQLKVEYSCGSADYYLERTSGTCFKSSVSRAIKAGRRGSLSPMELRILGAVDYLFD